MVRFLRVAKSRLYQSDGIGSDGDWWGFLLGEGIEPPADSIPLKEALNNDGLKGSFVYTAKAPKLDKTDQFIDKIAEIIKQKFNNRVIIFLASGASDEIIPDEVKTVISFGRSNESLKVTVGINVTLTGVEGIDANVADRKSVV